MDDDDILLADGFEDAFIGIGHRCGQPDVAIYSIPAAIEVLMTRDHVTREDAEEYLAFNSIGAWVGTRTPVWVDLMTFAELTDAHGVTH